MVSISSDAILSNYDESESKFSKKVNESEGISKENDNNAVSAPLDNPPEFEFDDEIFEAAIQHVNDIMSQEKAAAIDPLQHVYDHRYAFGNRNHASLPVQEPEQQLQSIIQESVTSAVFQGAADQQYRNPAVTQIQAPVNASFFNVQQQNVAQPSQQRAQVEYQKWHLINCHQLKREIIRNICSTHGFKFIEKAINWEQKLIHLPLILLVTH